MHSSRLLLEGHASVVSLLLNLRSDALSLLTARRW
jgi:hypothetical protein